MRYLRKIYRRIVSRNPERNTMDNLEADDEYHKLSDEDGCVESLYLKEESNCDCGCFAPRGGRCAESGCGKIACVNCFSHCGGNKDPHPDGCGKPLCREHSHYRRLDGRTIPFCRRCYGQLARRKTWHTLSTPLIDYEENANGR